MLKSISNVINTAIIEPIDTTLDLHKEILSHKDIIEGNYSIKWLEEIFLPQNTHNFKN